jgi:hypothetical protein
LINTIDELCVTQLSITFGERNFIRRTPSGCADA